MDQIYYSGINYVAHMFEYINQECHIMVLVDTRAK